MRLLIAAAAIAALFALASAHAAQAACCYDDVPTTHWAYKALGCLSAEGALAGYPEDYFAGDRPLTRYEFAQATALLLDSIQQKGAAHEVEVLAASLHSEFADQFSEDGQVLEGLSAQAAVQQRRIEGLGRMAEAHAARLQSLEARIAGMTAQPDWKGEFAYRWEVQRGAGLDGVTRFNQLACLRLGYTHQVSDEVLVGFRLVAGGSGLGNDPYLRFGSTAANMPQLGLDEAYVKYTPQWGGTYKTALGHEAPKVELTAGRLPHEDRIH
jgi:hypothetical protein